MKAGAALVVERLGHEGGQQTVQPGDLLHRGLQPEGPVRGVQRSGVVQVDLELAAAELVVGRGHLQAGVPQQPQRLEQATLRIALGAHCVDVAGGVRVALPAADGAGNVVGLEQVVLQLGADHGANAGLGEQALDPPQHRPGRVGAGAAVGVVNVCDRPGDTRLPGQRGQGGEVRLDLDVGQPGLEPAGHRHDVALRAGVEDRAAEGQAGSGGGGQLVEQQIPTAIDADHVGVRDPDDVDPLRSQLVHRGGDIAGRVAHGTSAKLFGPEQYAPGPGWGKGVQVLARHPSSGQFWRNPPGVLPEK